ncbi:MAG TPA: hypothetical protein VHF44_02085 [Nitrososphaeraceae archaeon]|nr:hypothetical protein [Nitrososphaeraceae archaeon]
MTKDPPTIPIDIASRYGPSSFKCFNCDKSKADFFVTKGSIQSPTDVVPLCFECYAHKRRWIWQKVRKPQQ